MLLFAALALALVEPAQQFDLECTGTTKSGARGRVAIPESSDTWTMRYRIDLASETWCREDCRSVLPIVENSPGQLVLVLPDGDYGPTIRLDRSTGEVLDLLETEAMGSVIYIRSTGACERADFSGFPAAKF